MIPTSHHDPRGQASAWVARFAPLVARGGAVLDLACGGGRHARLFHAAGHPVTAVDIDPRGVADLQGRPGVTILQADLEGDVSLDPGGVELGGPYAGIVVTNYLHRPLLPRLPGLLAPGGVLLYETFAQGNQRHGRPSSPAYLLRAGELLALARDTGLQVVAFEQGEIALPRAAVVQRLAAVRPLAAPDLDGDPEPRPLPLA
ncbi:class I SAM-dependent methyltransferase [Nitrospirillum viridazoti]|uniref:SAM-dependent methyltransferase n=1 Tax=Nitrospirillum viridazoti CBAmc TaxID=1441467 RepID=A0A248JLL0_9PROT|nr:class I SAM-dependent methyltransferase [Nitrospirillum amazonense]ASG19612.1 SAM-dependent methyltransferase [Nitrospirillum amazonense CBAmc]TWB27386.1 methyltransferase family protein [Nitrospirillum amazonense]